MSAPGRKRHGAAFHCVQYTTSVRTAQKKNAASRNVQAAAFRIRPAKCSFNPQSPERGLISLLCRPDAPPRCARQGFLLRG
ncbi:MAG TPA: hypothetical protein DDX51_06245 [Clostridiales bacterium]|nr:hypothetical protein [Clostridiales bacterium]